MSQDVCVHCKHPVTSDTGLYVEERGFWIHYDCVEPYQEMEDQLDRIQRLADRVWVQNVVSCPKCGAGIGFECKLPNGKRRKENHRAREKAIHHLGA